MTLPSRHRIRNSLRVRYLSVTEAPHNTDFHTWMWKKHFLFLSNRRDREPNPRTLAWKAAVLTTTQWMNEWMNEWDAMPRFVHIQAKLGQLGHMPKKMNQMTQPSRHRTRNSDPSVWGRSRYLSAKEAQKLAHRLWRWRNNKATLVWHVVFAGNC